VLWLGSVHINTFLSILHIMPENACNCK
jgi:hypothetical protein